MEREIQEMKCFAFRIAQTRWHVTPCRCAEIFALCGAYGFIEECYDILHLSGYECVVNDIEKIAAAEGIVI